MRQKKRVFFETEEVVKKTKRGYIDLDTDYFQFYNIAFQHLASLKSNCSKDFILWVMARVDENNEFSYNNAMYDEFIGDLQKITKPKTYSENTLHISIAELVSNEVLIHMSRGRYRVNPKLFWSVDISKRIEAVKQIHSNKIVVSESTEGTPLEIPEHKQNEEYEPEIESLSGTVPGGPDSANSVGLPGN